MTTKTTTFVGVDKTGNRYVYQEGTTSVTTGQVAKIDLEGGSSQTSPPNIGVEANERIPTMEETNQVYRDDKKTSKSKYSNKSRGFLGLRG